MSVGVACGAARCDICWLFSSHILVFSKKRRPRQSPPVLDQAGPADLSPSLWPWARQTSAGSPASSLLVRSGKTPEASGTWPTARWPAGASGCWWTRAGCGGWGSSTLRDKRWEGETIRWFHRFSVVYSIFKSLNQCCAVLHTKLQIAVKCHYYCKVAIIYTNLHRTAP